MLRWDMPVEILLTSEPLATSGRGTRQVSGTLMAQLMLSQLRSVAVSLPTWLFGSNDGRQVTHPWTSFVYRDHVLYHSLFRTPNVDCTRKHSKCGKALLGRSFPLSSCGFAHSRPSSRFPILPKISGGRADYLVHGILNGSQIARRCMVAEASQSAVLVCEEQRIIGVIDAEGSPRRFMHANKHNPKQHLPC